MKATTKKPTARKKAGKRVTERDLSKLATMGYRAFRALLATYFAWGVEVGRAQERAAAAAAKAKAKKRRAKP